MKTLHRFGAVIAALSMALMAYPAQATTVTECLGKIEIARQILNSEDVTIEGGNPDRTLDGLNSKLDGASSKLDQAKLDDARAKLEDFVGKIIELDTARKRKISGDVEGLLDAGEDALGCVNSLIAGY